MTLKELQIGKSAIDVPFMAVGCGDVKLREGGCLADIAPTMLPYIGLPVPAEMTGKSIIVE